MDIIAFKLIFTSIIFKHITDLKSLTYHVYNQNGIYHTLKPYIDKALKDGFLLPIIYKQNKLVEEGVKMFEVAYNIIKLDGAWEPFMRLYNTEVFNRDNDDIWDIDITILMALGSDDFQYECVKKILPLIV